jgi:hypothetical protein
MNFNLNMSKVKSKFVFGWNSINEFEHGKDEFKGWRTYKAIMVSEEAKVGAKGVNIINLQALWVYFKSMQNLLFHRFVLFRHKCRALFKHKSHVHNFRM